MICLDSKKGDDRDSRFSATRLPCKDFVLYLISASIFVLSIAWSIHKICVVIARPTEASMFGWLSTKVMNSSAFLSATPLRVSVRKDAAVCFLKHLSSQYFKCYTNTGASVRGPPEEARRKIAQQLLKISDARNRKYNSYSMMTLFMSIFGVCVNCVRWPVSKRSEGFGDRK